MQHYLLPTRKAAFERLPEPLQLSCLQWMPIDFWPACKLLMPFEKSKVAVLDKMLNNISDKDDKSWLSAHICYTDLLI